MKIQYSVFISFSQTQFFISWRSAAYFHVWFFQSLKLSLVGIVVYLQVVRTFDLSGHPDYRPLRPVILRLTRCVRILVVDLRDPYDELIAKARAWLDLALACSPRWQAQRKMKLLLVFGHADAVRVSKNPRTGLAMTGSAERVRTQMLILENMPACKVRG